MKKVEKALFVDNLSEELKSVASVVLVDYSGLTVKKQQELKKSLKLAGSKMFVAKNTLFKIAGRRAKLNEQILSDTVLSGPTAYVIAEGDPIAPLQVLAKFAKENELPQFKVGIVEGYFQNKENLIKLASLPSREILYSQVLGSVSAPLYGIVSTLQGNLQKLIYILDQKSKIN